MYNKLRLPYLVLRMFQLSVACPIACFISQLLGNCIAAWLLAWLSRLVFFLDSLGVALPPFFSCKKLCVTFHPSVCLAWLSRPGFFLACDSALNTLSVKLQKMATVATQGIHAIWPRFEPKTCTPDVQNGFCLVSW